ncbi:hypothetical protein PHIM7_345 [Sinorhizobium phage phiM7]|uniref:Uncharacterized protein n=2 Tax=Emdodecavirus TaxID=1980937 RepID=S5MQE5_9CAUD|nr:hypothetical protein AB690_gp170 [Sinorhizobium phage phiM12]YP_009601470.1 hypothetical protein FDH46_gp133 [Sinorhizobium phage phiM7]AGR48075.1 hypothetical protein SmphiM12_443 [Sinorhizobium phage phiM12]AKF12890.1 hypothetical protein PHIM7_345 [Sinorhizobium phage phiM7]AKF13250.1 hypothetical protein PHIM19_345 [Sinorhizobium phage phiM19]
MISPERHLNAREARRLAAEDRYLTRLEKREREAEALVGELCREGKTIYYTNIKTKTGKFTGKIKEFTGPTAFGEAIVYLIRNNYV